MGYLDFDLENLSSLFAAQRWLEENFGCEFIPSSGGWEMSSCPFDDHADASPSFGINQEENRFNCLGCGRAGDLAKMVSLLLRVNFPQAVGIMSEYAGVSLNSIDLLDAKSQNIKRLIESNNEQMNKNARIVQQVTAKIKRIMKNDFVVGDELYKKMDDYIKQEDYKSVKEIINGTTR